MTKAKAKTTDKAQTFKQDSEPVQTLVQSEETVASTSLTNGEILRLMCALDGVEAFCVAGNKIPAVKLKELDPAQKYQVYGFLQGALQSGAYAKEGEYDEYALLCNLGTEELLFLSQTNQTTRSLAEGDIFSPFDTGALFKEYPIWGIVKYTVESSDDTVAVRNEEKPETKTKPNWDTIPF